MMKAKFPIRAAAVLVSLGVFLGAAQIATADFPTTPGPVPVSILLDPTAPAPTPVFVCTWIKVTGPGPHPFTPHPSETRPIMDVEIDILNDGLPPFGLDPVPEGDAPWGPFLSWELLDEVVDGEDVYQSVGHWYGGELLQGEIIEIECPDAGAEESWYVHFTTPEPATLVLLLVGGAGLILRRRRGQA